MTFLYIYKLSAREIEKAIPFAIASERIKHQGINLPKEMKDLYTETYKKAISD